MARKRKAPPRVGKGAKSSARKSKVIEPEVIEAELVEETSALAVPERGELAVPPEADVMRMWLSAHADLTRRNYMSDMRCFASFMGCSERPDLAIEQLVSLPDSAHANTLVLRYKSWLREEKGYSPATINRRLAALRSVTKMARMVGKVDWRIEIENVKKRSKRDTAGPGVDGFQRLMAQADAELEAALDHGTKVQQIRTLRDRTLLSLYYYAGLRRFEPLTIDYPSGLRTRQITETDADGQPAARTIYEAHIVGKKRDGDREWISIGRQAWEHVEQWVAVRGDQRGPLFPGRAGKGRLKPGSVNKTFAGLAARADVDSTPHGLRHTAITRILDKSNGNIRLAQQFARHASPATTTVYDDNRRSAASKATELLEDD